MPDPTLSAAIREAYASAPDDVVLVQTIEIAHSTLDVPLRFVNDSKDHRFDLEGGQLDVLFTAYPFTAQRPRVDDKGAPALTLIIDNVTRDITAALENAIATLDPVYVSWREHDANDPTAVLLSAPLTGTISDVSVTQSTVTAEVRFFELGTRSLPYMRFTLKRFPGLATTPVV